MARTRIVDSSQQDLVTRSEGPVQKPGWLVGSKSSVTEKAVELWRKPLGVIGKEGTDFVAGSAELYMGSPVFKGLTG